MKETWIESTAPGRLDVMGGIADYSGSLVLQMPIRENTTVRLRLRNDFQCTIVSRVDGQTLEASVDYRTILNNGKPDFQHAQQFFRKNEGISWSAYVLGCAIVLQKQKLIDFKGADFIIESSVPLGKGVSSSASIEVAVMKALQQAFGLQFAGTELPTLAQTAENLVVGAACGLMDQLASYFGQRGKLLPIVCQPDLLKEPIDLPREIHFIGIDSGVRHSVGGSSYTDVRCAAFMGYSIIARHLGVEADELFHAGVSGVRANLPFSGYLSNISVNQYESEFEKLLPEKMSGAEFIQTIGHIIDSVTQVNPDVSYSIKACASHPVYENHRVHTFMEILQSWKSTQPEVIQHALRTLGDLMTLSHQSYSACGLGSERTDEIVEQFQKFPSVAGAKITGGGSGGTVCALAVGDEGINDALRVHSHFSKKYMIPLRFFK
ncbi:MAG TPA: hypothetical protein VGD65_24795 [Chryseosolibacter sp.]